MDDGMPRVTVKHEVSQIEVKPNNFLSFGKGDGDNFVPKTTIKLSRVEVIQWGDVGKTETIFHMFSGARIGACLDEKSTSVINGLFWSLRG